MGIFYSKSSCFCPDTVGRSSTLAEAGENSLPQNELVLTDNEITEFERIEEISSSSPTGCSNYSSQVFFQHCQKSESRTRVVSRNALQSSTNLVQRVRNEFSEEAIAKGMKNI